MSREGFCQGLASTTQGGLCQENKRANIGFCYANKSCSSVVQVELMGKSTALDIGGGVSPEMRHALIASGLLK